MLEREATHSRRAQAKKTLCMPAHRAPVALPAALFPAAPTTDVVRSVQRDTFAVEDLRASVSSASEVLLGVTHPAPL